MKRCSLCHKVKEVLIKDIFIQLGQTGKHYSFCTECWHEASLGTDIIAMLGSALVNRKEIELTPLQKVVTAYKISKGHAKEDKLWDKVYYGRCSKSAKVLLDYLGSWESAVDCIEWVQKELEKKALDWTLETVVKRAGDFKIQLAEAK